MTAHRPGDAIEAIPGIQELWERTLGDPRVTVGLIEGPPDLDHPCFAGADLTVVEPAWLPRIPVHEAAVQHGTYVASVLFGQHGGPVRGLAPGCRGVIVPALLDQDTVLDPLNAVRAIEAAVEAGADIVHFAGAHPTCSDDTIDLLKRLITRVTEAGVLVVAPAGNDYGQRRVVPGLLPEVLAVGAYDENGTMFRFSNWGPAYRDHGIVAPGGGVTAAEPGGGTVTHKGTSVSAPIVSGVAALLASLRVAHGLPPDPIAVRDVLIVSARPCTAEESHGEPDRCLAGRLDVPAATGLVLAGGSRAAEGNVSLSARGPRGRWPDLVFAIGELGYDFGSGTRRDALLRQLGPVDDPAHLVAGLRKRPELAGELVWTLTVESVPVYAIGPASAYADDVLGRLVDLLEVTTEVPIRISVPGRLTGGAVPLLSGRSVPAVEIEQLRGLSGWDPVTLARSALDAVLDAHPGILPRPLEGEALAALRDFLHRVYFGLSNLGARSSDRALNFAAVDAFQAAVAVATATAGRFSLAAVGVERSPYGRPNSDCWDVVLRFADPDGTRRAGTLFRLTLDVSDLYPVTVGAARAWRAT
jgi:subtilisin family serine protease